MSPKQFGPILGIVTAANGGVAGIDGYLGGLLSDHFGFRSIFVFIILVGVIAFFGGSSFLWRGQSFIIDCVPFKK